MKAELEFLSLKGDTDVCSVNKCERMLELGYSASPSGSFASFLFCFVFLLHPHSGSTAFPIQQLTFHSCLQA